jgi:hypothetical protein
MEIKPIYVTFEQQHKLIEKGCDIQTTETRYGYELFQQWQVIEWLRLNYQLDLWCESGYYKGKKYYPMCTKDGSSKNLLRGMQPFEFETPQEGYEHAITFILTQLI